MGALRQKDSARVQMLLAKGADPNEKDASGEPPLCTAVKQEDEASVRALLGARAEPTVDCSGTSALTIAAVKHANGVFSALLDGGTDPVTQGANEKVPLLVAMAESKEYDDVHGMTAVFLEHIEKKYGRERAIDTARGGKTADTREYLPLTAAAYRCDEPMVRALVKYGANPNQLASVSNVPGIRVADSWPPLFFARAGAKVTPKRADECLETFNALLAAGADGEARTGTKKTWEQAQDAWAESRARRAREEADWQAAVAADRRRGEQWKRQQRSQPPSGGGGGRTNPLDDNSFQESLSRQAGRPPITPSRTVAPSTTSGTSGSTSGEGTIYVEEIAPPPAAAPAPSSEPIPEAPPMIDGRARPRKPSTGESGASKQ